MVNGKRYFWSLHTGDPDLARFLVRQILDAEFNAGVPKQNVLAWGGYKLGGKCSFFYIFLSSVSPIHAAPKIADFAPTFKCIVVVRRLCKCCGSLEFKFFWLCENDIK